jgi:co-chaperonin GroES (HSP10)
MKKNVLTSSALALVLAVASGPLLAQAGAQAASASAGVIKQLGSIRTIHGSDLSLATDQGTELAVKVQPGARLLRLAPGQTDLKSAAPIQLTDLQVGDRVLIRGKLAEDGVAVDASAVIVMKQQDIAQRQQQELQDWQRRSVGGLVKQVDSAAGAITLSIAGVGDIKNVTVTTTPKTTFKRYSPDSTKWEDASAATLADIHPGDQLRAKGYKSADGSQIVAEEIVAGTFRNISGLISTIDPAQSTVTIQDLATKKPVTVKITPDSQMKKLPAQVARGLAMRMKGLTPSSASASAQAGTPADSARPHAGDINQMLSRLPAATLGDLQKGDAVMIVSTQGSGARPPAAITLLGGVEPILTASPNGKGAESFLTPWSLASAPGGDQ